MARRRVSPNTRRGRRPSGTREKAGTRLRHLRCALGEVGVALILVAVLLLGLGRQLLHELGELGLFPL